MTLVIVERLIDVADHRPVFVGHPLDVMVVLPINNPLAITSGAVGAQDIARPMLLGGARPTPPLLNPRVIFFFNVRSEWNSITTLTNRFPGPHAGQG